MKKSVLIIGVSGTGKSSVSEMLRELGYASYDLEEVEGLYTMFDKATGKPMTPEVWDNNNPKIVERMKWMCDIQKLASLIESQKGDLAFYAGSAENTLEMMRLFSKVLVLNAREATIRKRLSTRTSNDFARVEAVQDMVIGWKTWFENEAVEHGGILVDSDQSLREVAESILVLSKD